MREILFRGKRKDTGEWGVGLLTKRPSAIQIGDMSPWFIDVPPAHPEDDGGFYNVDPATVGQYTGLKDKNGKRIFEGDIICHYNNPEDPKAHDDGVVWWDNDHLCFKRTSGEESVFVWKQMGGCYYEVIGNIHDNPEFVERGVENAPDVR